MNMKFHFIRCNIFFHHFVHLKRGQVTMVTRIHLPHTSEIYTKVCWATVDIVSAYYVISDVTSDA